MTEEQKENYKARARAKWKTRPPSPAQRERAKKRAAEWYRNNKERALAWSKERRTRPDYDAKARGRSYYLRHRSVFIKKAKEWRKANPEKARKSAAETSRRWRKKNPEKVKAQKCARKHRKRGGGPLRPSTLREVRKEFCCCVYCESKENLTVEHLVSLSRRGTNEKKNLVLACRTCNSSKRDEDFRTWFRRKPFFDPSKLALLERRIAARSGDTGGAVLLA